ncbi:MAG: UDP-N-acetylmuramoyl-tripeptide--D-alanyl-D-alanine ligase [Myxococcota bacterium]
MSVLATAEDLSRWTNGQLLRGRTKQTFASSVIDSREISGDSLFVAIVGPNHDAHQFVDSVLEKGAAGVLISSNGHGLALDKGDGFVIRVEDTTAALAELARGHRQSFHGPLIGITGSNGKTTTKELCAGILTRVGPTLATRGNLNNHFGVPLTLLRRSESIAYAVIEMGMNHRFEIASLASIAQPTIGVLTNLGSAHIEFLGSREAIAEEKGDLLAALPAHGTAVIGRDDPIAYAQAKRTTASVLSYGRKAAADLRASEIHADNDGTFRFLLESPYGRDQIRVPGLAETIVENALAAAGGAFAAGASFEAVALGLANHCGVPGRMQPRKIADDILLIDDSYNANPQSMKSALETLARLETKGQRLAVLGEMGELGNERQSGHREAGVLAGSLALDGLYLLGASAIEVAEGALESGLPENRIHIENDHDALILKLREDMTTGDRILIKGSRASRMERIVEALEGEGL